MKKISTTAWLMMFVIVGIHLCIVGSVMYFYWEPIKEFLFCAWGYVTFVHKVFFLWVIDVYDKMPSPQQLVDGFINILKLKPFAN